MPRIRAWRDEAVLTELRVTPGDVTRTAKKAPILAWGLRMVNGDLPHSVDAIKEGPYEFNVYQISRIYSDVPVKLAR